MDTSRTSRRKRKLVGVTATPITVGRSHVAPKSVRCQSESFPPSDNANSPGCWGGLPCAYYYPSRYGSAVSKPVLDAREIASPRVALGLPRARAWTAWEWCAAVAKSAIQCRPRRSDEWSRNLRGGDRRRGSAHLRVGTKVVIDHAAAPGMSSRNIGSNGYGYRDRQ
jgi:hypothetical protein